MEAYLLAITIYRYILPHLGVVYGILMNANFEVWEKLAAYSPAVGMFILGAWLVRYHYESQKTDENKRIDSVNTKIKELSDQHVEEFKTLSEQQQVRYDKEMVTKDDFIKVKDKMNADLVEQWRAAVQNGIDSKDKAIQYGNDSKDEALELMRAYYDLTLEKKDAIIAHDKAYIREQEKELKEILNELRHSFESMNDYITREHTGGMLEIHKLLTALISKIDNKITNNG